MFTVHAVDWGDVPTWVSAVTTAGALIAAGIVVRIEMRRDRRSVDTAERAEQANQVAIWHVSGSERLRKAHFVLRNASTLPIYNVRVTMRAGKVVEEIPLPNAVPPGESVVHYPETLLHAIGDCDVELRFTDTAGRSWARRSDGQLRRLPDVYARTVFVDPEDRVVMADPEDQQ